MLTVTKYDGSSMPRDAMEIDLPSRGTWSDFLKPTNGDMRLDHEREVSTTREF